MRLARPRTGKRKDRSRICGTYEKINWYQAILSDEKILAGVIKGELLEIKEKFSDERRTEIVADSSEIDESDLIQEQQVAITLTHLGYIKRVAMDTYKTQKRGGKGITGITTRENDFVKNMIITSTHDHLMFFTNTGKAHRMKAS